MEPVSYYWHEGDWNVLRILQTVPMPFAQTICQIPIAAGQGDKIVWTRSSAGDFSTKSAWEAIRQASPRRQLLADVCGMLRSIVGYRSRPRALFLRSSTIYTHYGSSFRNPSLAGAAGIIRDSAGHVHLAYQIAVATGTSVLAELTVVWRGLELALTHGLAPLVVEVDAMAVISLVQSRVSGKWEVQHLIMRIVRLQQLLVADIQHVFREANSAVDHLAKEVASLQLTRVLHHNDITGVLHGILCLDRRGVPHLRGG
ncbi:UNVERIFIED_CONTAM: hypothetical protein Scaly_2214000 [Sesamum calycinum]|uniref:RNase H type-1 domain-containing protein n=1 Tax=Sesamum calycinum TaxID=2727403 RepID=A0AAW2MPP2_9LAMI